jgi:hypothetical protein
MENKHSTLPARDWCSNHLWIQLPTQNIHVTNLTDIVVEGNWNRGPWYKDEVYIHLYLQEKRPTSKSWSVLWRSVKSWTYSCMNFFRLSENCSSRFVQLSYLTSVWRNRWLYTDFFRKHYKTGHTKISCFSWLHWRISLLHSSKFTDFMPKASWILKWSAVCINVSVP